MAPVAFRRHAPSRYAARTFAALGPLFQASARETRVVLAPDSSNASIAADGSYEHRVSVPAGSALWAIAATCSQAAGFTLNIVDAAGTQLASQALSNLNGPGSVTYKDSRGATHTISDPLVRLPKYLVVPEPGVVRVKLVNLAGVANRIRTALYFSIPSSAAPNEYDAHLTEELGLARRAIRNIDTTGQPSAPVTADPMSQPATHVPFNVSTVGNNIVVQGVQGYVIAIHQLSLYSTAVQTIRLLDRDADLMGSLDDFDGGYMLPYSPDPHFVLGDGNSFVIKLAAGSGGSPTGKVTGFLKYRVFERWPL